jgi:Uma2 family endonuclease
VSGRMSGMPGSDDLKPAGVKLTYDDYLLFPEDGFRHELIDGEHYVTPSPLRRHQEIVGNLHWLIRSHLEAHPVGRVYVAPFDVIFSRYDVVEPDVLYLSNQRAAEILRDYVHGAPDLVIEVGSAGTRRRDETVKRSLYERDGVTEYWIVDPEIDVVRIYQRRGDRFERPIELSREAGDVVRTPLLPQFEITLTSIFKE